MSSKALFHVTVKGVVVYQNQLLLLKKVKPSKDNYGYWELPGGGMEYNESPVEAIKREVFEETGLTLTNASYRGIVTFVSNKWETEYMHLFTATEFEGEVTECDEGELCWVDKKELLDLPLWEGDKLFLKLLDNENEPFFSLKLEYIGDKLTFAALNGETIELDN